MICKDKQWSCKWPEEELRWKHQGLQGFLACSYAQSQQTERFFRVSLLLTFMFFFSGGQFFHVVILLQKFTVSRDGSLDFIIKSSTHWLLCQPSLAVMSLGLFHFWYHRQWYQDQSERKPKLNTQSDSSICLEQFNACALIHLLTL